jgi:integrase
MSTQNKPGRIAQFFKQYSSKNTLITYNWILTSYFKFIFGEKNLNGNHDNAEKLEQLAEQYFTEKRDYETDIQNYFSEIKTKPPKTVSVSLACVKTFLVENDVELPAKFWRHIHGRIRGSRALTQDKVPNNQELRRILMHMPIHGKALFDLLASSGMRIGEAIQLKLADLDLAATPCKITIKGEYTKTGNPRIAFASKEATMFLEEWIKDREKYLKAAVGKSHKFAKSLDDNRVFPFEVTVAYSMWDKALEKSGFQKLDSSTNRRTVHAHTLRKFFRTRLGAVIPVDIAEALMGHEEYLTEVYRKYSEEDLAKFYTQGESALLIFSNAEEISALRVEVKKKSGQLQDVVNMLAVENADLKRRIQTTEGENTDLKQRIQRVEESLPDIAKLEAEIKKLMEELRKDQNA